MDDRGLDTSGVRDAPPRLHPGGRSGFLDTVVSCDSNQEALEVIRMPQWAKTQHMPPVDGVPKKQITRGLGLDVTTVRRAVAQARRSDRRRCRSSSSCGTTAGAERASQHRRPANPKGTGRHSVRSANLQCS